MFTHNSPSAPFLLELLLEPLNAPLPLSVASNTFELGKRNPYKHSYDSRRLFSFFASILVSFKFASFVEMFSKESN